MPDPAPLPWPIPFTAFNFAVEINRGEDGNPLVNASFAECDGLEMNLEVKTIREGGSNDRQSTDTTEHNTARKISPSRRSSAGRQRLAGVGVVSYAVDRACDFVFDRYSQVGGALGRRRRNKAQHSRYSSHVCRKPAHAFLHSEVERRPRSHHLAA